MACAERWAATPRQSGLRHRRPDRHQGGRRQRRGRLGRALEVLRTLRRTVRPVRQGTRATAPLALVHVVVAESPVRRGGHQFRHGRREPFRCLSRCRWVGIHRSAGECDPPSERRARQRCRGAGSNAFGGRSRGRNCVSPAHPCSATSSKCSTTGGFAKYGADDRAPLREQRAAAEIDGVVLQRLPVDREDVALGRLDAACAPGRRRSPWPAR